MEKIPVCFIYVCLFVLMGSGEGALNIPTSMFVYFLFVFVFFLFLLLLFACLFVYVCLVVLGVEFWSGR
jgi:hypothetical protein